MKTITNNEVLFSCKSKFGDILTLHKQSYSDGTCFFTLEDRNGNWKLEYGNHKISALLKQVKREIKIDSSVEKENFYKTNPEIKAIYDSIKDWKQKIANNLKTLSLKEVI